MSFYIVCLLIAVFVAMISEPGFIWFVADVISAMMTIPNLIMALALLSPVVFKITKEFFDSRGKSENNEF